LSRLQYIFGDWANVVPTRPALPRLCKPREDFSSRSLLGVTFTIGLLPDWGPLRLVSATLGVCRRDGIGGFRQ